MGERWRRFVLWLAREEIHRLEYEADDYRRHCERLNRYLEHVQAERDAYRGYANRLMDLQAEALSLQPPAPIILPKRERGA